VLSVDFLFEQNGRVFTKSYSINESKYDLYRVNNKFLWKIASRKDGTREMRAFAVGSQDPPPFNLTIYKGRKAWKLPRSFVKFLLTHPVVHQFGKWARTISISDEYFIATLARISDTTMTPEGTWRVSQDSEPGPNNHLQIFSHYKRPCYGVFRRQSCVMTLMDLPTLLSGDYHIANKVVSSEDPTLAECLREIHNNKLL